MVLKEALGRLDKRAAGVETRRRGRTQYFGAQAVVTQAGRGGCGRRREQVEIRS